jgi:RNA polymerase sigma-70 factor (ECF subfamily)
MDLSYCPQHLYQFLSQGKEYTGDCQPHHWSIEAHDPVNEMLKQLYRMINQLGQLDKSIILLYLEEKSYEEIAEITGLTVTNVATKLSRIKDKLKKMKKED